MPSSFLHDAADQIRANVDENFKVDDVHWAAETIIERALYLALDAVETMMTDERELYTADDAIGCIRAWADVNGLSVAVIPDV